VLRGLRHGVQRQRRRVLDRPDAVRVVLRVVDVERAGGALGDGGRIVGLPSRLIVHRLRVSALSSAGVSGA
jgi:hypothetical protein